MAGQRNDIKKHVADNIRAARMGQGITQKELAERLNVQESVTGNYESGKRNLTIETIQKIADALGVNIVTLIQ